MTLSIHQVATHMEAQMRSMEVVANNLANVNTPGFRRMISHFATSSADTRYWGHTQISFPRLNMTHIDHAQGPIKHTGRRLDVAINGDAFLVVETEDGPMLTRKGRMHLDREGVLRDAAGHPFATDAGAVQLPPDWTELEIDRYGAITVDGELLAHLTLVSVPDKENIHPLGDSLMEYRGENLEPAVHSEVIQGAVEKSNVEPVTEMVNLMRAGRSYESGSQIMRRIDRTLGMHVNTAR